MAIVYGYERVENMCACAWQVCVHTNEQHAAIQKKTQRAAVH